MPTSTAVSNEHDDGSARLLFDDRLLQCHLTLAIEVRVWLVRPPGTARRIGARQRDELQLAPREVSPPDPTLVSYPRRKAQDHVVCAGRLRRFGRGIRSSAHPFGRYSRGSFRRTTRPFPTRTRCAAKKLQFPLVKRRPVGPRMALGGRPNADQDAYQGDFAGFARADDGGRLTTVSTKRTPATIGAARQVPQRSSRPRGSAPASAGPSPLACAPHA